MRGMIMHFEPSTGLGVIRGSDEKRYTLAIADWGSGGSPVPGQQVDFEVDNGRAIAIYKLPVAASSTLGTPPFQPNNMASMRQSIGEAAGHAAASAQGFAHSQVGQRVLADWSVVFAILIFLGCLLPYISVGRESANLFGAVGQVNQALDGLRQLNTMFSGFGARPGMAQTQANDTSGFLIIQMLMTLLYLIPILALATIVLTALGRNTGLVTTGLGIVAATLPWAVPLLSSMIIWANLPPSFRQAAQQFGGGGQLNLSFLGFGFWLIFLSAIALLLARFGVIKPTPSSLLNRGS